jgi:hypothetical protein
MLQVFHISKVHLESHGGTARAPREGERRAGSQWMGRTARLGSCGQGVPVLISAPESHPCGDRVGGQGKERQAQGRAKRTGAEVCCGAGRGRWRRTVVIRWECGAFLIGRSAGPFGYPIGYPGARNSHVPLASAYSVLLLGTGFI